MANATPRGKSDAGNPHVDMRAVNPRHLVYRAAAREAGIQRRVSCALPTVGLTEHPLADGRTVVVAINYEPTPVTAPLAMTGSVGGVWRGKVTDRAAAIPAKDAVVFVVQ